MTFDTTQKRLLIAGAVLFLAGLLQGGLVQQFVNPRMALSAHLTAVQSGLAIMVSGIAWGAVALGRRASAMARWGITAGMWLLWIALTIAAMNGASDVLPIAGAGHSAVATGETLVSLLVGISATAMSVGWTIMVWGLVRGSRRPD